MKEQVSAKPDQNDKDVRSDIYEDLEPTGNKIGHGSTRYGSTERNDIKSVERDVTETQATREQRLEEARESTAADDVTGEVTDHGR